MFFGFLFFLRLEISGESGRLDFWLGRLKGKFG